MAGKTESKPSADHSVCGKTSDAIAARVDELASRTCHYCKRRMRRGVYQLQPTRDHIVPQRLGGKQTVPCCRQCNSIKGGMSLEEWSDFMDRYPEWWLTFYDAGCVSRLRQALRWSHRRQVTPPARFPDGLVPMPPLCRGLALSPTPTPAQ